MPDYTSILSGIKHTAKTAVIPILVVVAGYGGYAIGYKDGSGTLVSPPGFLGLYNTATLSEPALVLEDPGKSVDFSTFWRTWHILEKNFNPAATSTFSASTTEARVAGAIAGLAQSYGDPYTVFIPKQQAQAFKESVNGEFEGIGAVLSQEGGVTFVSAILPGSPAESVGLEVGTRLIAVDGHVVAGEPLPEIVTRIRGAKGTDVVLTTLSQKSATQADITITRGVVAIPTTATRVVSAAKSVIDSVVEKTKKRIEGLAGAVGTVASQKEIEEEVKEAESQEFFVLQLVQFAKSSVDAFIKNLGDFADSDTPYLIIDLRGNPGGFLEVAVDLASYFLPKDTLVVSSRTGPDATPTEYKSVGHHTLDKLKGRRIVVLVDKNSASASEILAGALQDHGVAKVVGERSFGKGSVQSLVDIGELGSLKITISRWYTPNGRNISESGVRPDVVVNPSDPKFASSTDPFMDAATETLLDDSLW